MRFHIAGQGSGVSNDNPFIESLFKTLKYRVNYPLRFRDLIHARKWMASFVNW
ncbi:MAG: transposase [Chlorobiaceae bacterium]|nr:transposase [Chlorobiaceae bacterium]